MDWLRRGRERLHRLPGWVADGALAVLLTAVELSLLWVLTPSERTLLDFAGPTPLAVAVVCLATLPVAVRRRYPVAAFGVVAVAAGLTAVLAIPAQRYGLLVALYTVAAYSDRRRSLAALGVIAAGSVAATLAVEQLRLLPFTVVTFGAAWLLGDRQRTRRAYTAELEQRAALLEREREERARVAVAEERSRLARELHDVVAHSVSVMIVQASAARRLLRRDPAAADEPLAQVEATGRQSLTEVRRLLEALHDGDRPQLGPQPGVAQLGELVDEVREAGLAVYVSIEGEPRPLPSAVDVSVHRIVREALANVVKHAGSAATATVLLSYADRELQVEVVDDGLGPVPGSLADPGGQGLVGVRERVALLGGSFSAGPGPDGGFRLRAALPLDGASASAVARRGRA